MMSGHCVYRMFNTAGDVIYVGRTSNLDVRMRSHKSRSPWWPDVANVTFDECDTYEQSLHVERQAIADAQPRYNDQFTSTVDPVTEHLIGYPVSYTTFNNHKCRCEGCRTAKNEYTKTKPPSRVVMSRARVAAVRWLRDNHPDVWRAFVVAEYERLGVTPPDNLVARPPAGGQPLGSVPHTAGHPDELSVARPLPLLVGDALLTSGETTPGRVPLSRPGAAGEVAP